MFHWVVKRYTDHGAEYLSFFDKVFVGWSRDVNAGCRFENKDAANFARDFLSDKVKDEIFLVVPNDHDAFRATVQEAIDRNHGAWDHMVEIQSHEFPDMKTRLEAVKAAWFGWKNSVAKLKELELQ